MYIGVVGQGSTNSVHGVTQGLKYKKIRRVDLKHEYFSTLNKLSQVSVANASNYRVG